MYELYKCFKTHLPKYIQYFLALKKYKIQVLLMHNINQLFYCFNVLPETGFWTSKVTAEGKDWT